MATAAGHAAHIGLKWEIAGAAHFVDPKKNRCTSEVPPQVLSQEVSEEELML